MVAIIGYLFSPVGLTVILGVLIWLFFRSSTKQHTIWKDRGIPYVEPKPFFGSLLDNMKKPLHETEEERYKQYGPIYGHFEGKSVLLSVADPKLLRNIMVKDFHIFTDRRTLSTGDPITECMVNFLQGEDWKRVRTIITPTFTTGKIKRMMSIFSSCSEVLVNNFRTFAQKNEPVEVKSIYGAFTMDIIASAAFSTKIDSHNDPNNEFVRVARGVFKKDINYRFVFYLLFPRLMKFFKVPVFPPEGVKFFKEITLQIMEHRNRTGETRNDFIQLLMDTAKEQSTELEENKDEILSNYNTANKIFPNFLQLLMNRAKHQSTELEDEILSNYKTEGNDQFFKNFKPAKKNLTLNELVAQCIIFFLTGFETTASTLSFVTYYLALHPDIQNRLIEEIDRTIKESNGKMTYEGIQGMKYLDNVISESMRLNPPSIRLERVASADYELGDTGFVVPKGTVITIPIYAIQRDEKYFPDPTKFDPDRFSASERARRDPYAFMPFGAGPRNCVGMRFALVEVKVCLAHLLSRFRIRKCEQTKVPLDYHICQGLLQPKDTVVQMDERNDSPLSV